MKNIQLFKTLVLALIMVLVSNTGFTQGNWNFVSPVPGARYATIEHNVIIRSSQNLDVNSVDKIELLVLGSRSGVHTGALILASDMRTLIFDCDRNFAFDEEVQVSFESRVFSESAVEMPPLQFAFKTMQSDNTPLKIEYQAYYLNDLKRSAAANDFPSGSPEFKNTSNDNLPEDLPVITPRALKSPAPGFTFITPNNTFAATPQPSYSMMVDKYGTPVYFKKFNGGVADLKIQESGQISHFLPSSSLGLGVIYGSHLVYNSYMSVVDTFEMKNGYLAEIHDFLLLENGHSVMFTYDPQVVDMSGIVPGGDPSATVLGFILQELDADRNVVFEWSSWDHIPITDAVDDLDLTSVFIDYVHGNAVDVDDDNNYLISFRHTDEIIKVSRETGEIMWRLNTFRDNLNSFTFTNDTIQFSHQHDVRRLENGNISIFDNGNLHWGPYSRVVEYALDEENMTAELVWAYPPEPAHTDFAFAMGGAHRLENGNTMIGWGVGFGPMKIASEVSANHEITQEFWTADTLRTYRAYKFDWETDLFALSKDTINYGEFTGYNGVPVILQVTNSSAEDIVISGSHNHSPAFSMVGVFPTSIEPGATKNFTVVFFPSVQGQFEDILSIYCDLGEDSKIAKQVVLMGYNQDNTAPGLSFSPGDGAVDISRMPRIALDANEKLYNTDGSELSSTDLAEMLVFKKDDINGEDVLIFAGISWYETTKTQLFITPVDSLAGMQKYYVALLGNKVQDWAGNTITADYETSFTTEASSSGLFDYEAIKIQLYPNPATDVVHLSFPESGAKLIELFNLAGNRISYASTNQQTESISLKGLPHGIYFVKVKFENGQSGSAKIILE